MALGFKVGVLFEGDDKISSTFRRMGNSAKAFGEKTSRAFGSMSRSARGFRGVAKASFKGIKGAAILSAKATSRVFKTAFKLIGAGARRLRGVLRRSLKPKGVIGDILKAGAIQRGFDLLARGISSVATEFVEFDDAIIAASARFKDIGVTSKNYKEQLIAIKIAAREAGATTEFTATQSAKALDFMAKAGFTSVEAISSLNSMLNLATATGNDFARATDISSDLMGAFGLNVEDPIKRLDNLNRLNNVLVKTTNSANVNMEDLFETMKVIGPIAKGILGASLEEIASLTAIMGNAGIKGSNAMTALKNAYLNLAAPVGAGAEVLSELNLTLDDGLGGAKKMSVILKEVGDKIAGFGKVKQARILDVIFGKRAIAGSKNLIDNIKNINEFEQTLLSVGNASEETANLMRTSLGNRLKALGSAANEVGFQLFDAFETEGKGGIVKLTEFLRKIDTKPVIEGIKTVVKFTGEMIEKFKAFGEETGIFGAIKESIKAAIPLIKDVIKFVGEVQQKFIDIAERTGLFDKITTGIKAVVPFFSTVLSVVSTIFTFLERIGVFDALAEGIGFVIDTLVKLGDKFAEIWKTIKPFFDGIKDFTDLKTKFGFGGSALSNIAAARARQVEGGGFSIGAQDVTDLIKSTTSRLEAALTLDITGAPKGSTVSQSPGSGNDIDVTIMGLD